MYRAQDMHQRHGQLNKTHSSCYMVQEHAITDSNVTITLLVCLYVVIRLLATWYAQLYVAVVTLTLMPLIHGLSEFPFSGKQSETIPPPCCRQAPKPYATTSAE